MDLSPDHPVHFRTPAPAGPLTLAVLDASGAELIRYQEAQAPRTVPLRDIPKPANPPAVGDLLSQAMRAEELNDPAKARWPLSAGSGPRPGLRRGEARVGRLALKARPAEAAALLAEASARAPERADVAYYLGLALSRSGDSEAAEPELWKAAHDPAFAHAARLELGALAMSRGEWEHALELLSVAASCTVDDVRARCWLAGALRHAGRPTAALTHVKSAHAESPLDRLALMETYFCARALGKERLAAQQVKALVKMLPAHADPWLELALDYAVAGMPEDAREVLRLGVAHVKAAAAHPIVYYALAFWEPDPQAAADHRRQAAALSPRYVFPYHRELEPILYAALAADPSDARASYYLGLLLYSQGRREEGQAAWKRAAAGMTDFYILFRNLALAARQVQDDPAQAEEWLRRAVALRPNDTRPYLELDEIFRRRRTSPEIRLSILDHALPSVQRHGPVAAAQIDACLDLAQWERAMEEVRTHTFHRWEGEFSMRLVWVNLNLGRGAARFDAGDYAGAQEDFLRALEYPSNLRIGRLARRLDARSHWCVGCGYEALGDLAAAQKHWEEAAVEPPTYNDNLAQIHGRVGPETLLYHALALRKLGRGEEAEQALTGLLEHLRTQPALDEISTAFFLGATLKALGRTEEAIASLQQGLSLYPWQPRATRLLERDVIL